MLFLPDLIPPDDDDDDATTFPAAKDGALAAAAEAAADDVVADDGEADEEGELGIGSTACPALRRILLMELTEGMLLGSVTLCESKVSLISQANMAGFSDLTRRIRFTTEGVATC